MTLREIRESGLLELYILGDLTPGDEIMVNTAIEQYPELRKDIKEIEKALAYYAQSHAIQPPHTILDRLLDELNKRPQAKSKNTNSGNSKGKSNWLLRLLGLACVALIGLLNGQRIHQREIMGEYNRLKVECDSLRNVQTQKMDLYDQIHDANNQIIRITATEKYPETNLYFHSNTQQGKNLLQILNLPSITENQSYQLWSLKEGQDPIPLTVFQGTEGALIEVAYESGTGTYAITIEPRGGQQSPTLTNLIGTFSI